MCQLPQRAQGLRDVDHQRVLVPAQGALQHHGELGVAVREQNCRNGSLQGRAIEFGSLKLAHDCLFPVG